MGTSASPWTLAWASTACQKGGLDSESRLSRSGLCCHECHEDQEEGNSFYFQGRGEVYLHCFQQGGRVKEKCQISCEGKNFTLL